MSQILKTSRALRRVVLYCMKSLNCHRQVCFTKWLVSSLQLY